MSTPGPAPAGRVASQTPDPHGRRSEEPRGPAHTEVVSVPVGRWRRPRSARGAGEGREAGRPGRPRRPGRGFPGGGREGRAGEGRERRAALLTAARAADILFMAPRPARRWPLAPGQADRRTRQGSCPASCLIGSCWGTFWVLGLRGGAPGNSGLQLAGKRRDGGPWVKGAGERDYRPYPKGPDCRNWDSLVSVWLSNSLHCFRAAAGVVSDAVGTSGDTPRLLGCVFTKEVL